MHESETPIPATKPQRSLLLRCFRWVLFGVGVFITVMAVVLTLLNWAGERSWKRYRAQLESKGEKLYLKDWIPPAVPEDQNFQTSEKLG